MPPGHSQAVVALLTALAAGGGALVGCHPTGTPIVDPLYTAIFAAGVTLIASRTSRAPLLVLAAVGVGLSRGWLLAPATGALAVAFISVLLRRPHRRVGALVGALGVQVLLRWPHVGFHGLTALVAGAVLLPCTVSAMTHLSRRGRRSVWFSLGGLGLVGAALSVPVVLGALMARSAVSGGVAAAEGALSTIGQSPKGSDVALDTATTDLSVAAARTGSWWTAGGLLVPVIAQQRRGMAVAAATGRDVVASAARVAPTVDFGDLGFHDGRFDTARIRSLTVPVDRLDSDLTRAGRRLHRIRSPWLVAPIQDRLDRLGAQLDRARSSANLAAQALRVAPGLLGADGTRHYLVAFMTPSESRGLDGLIAAYAELSVHNGRITLIRAGSTTGLDAAPAGSRHLTGPADYLARYGAFHPADHFQDLSYSPDFPSVADVITQLYPQSGGDHIDGVLALDPFGLAALLKLTGPVRVAGLATPLSSTNAASFLLEGQYLRFTGDDAAQAARHDFLQAALVAAFRRLTAGSLPGLRTIADELDPEVRQGRILFWTDHVAEQPLLRRTLLAGSFPSTPGRDVLAVTTQNAANDKIDAYLHRTIEDHVVFDPITGSSRSTVTIILHNSAPAAGLPRYVIGSYAGSHLAAGTNQTWLTVYTPLRFAAGTEDGARVGVTPATEVGVNTYSMYVDIGPGATVTLRLDLVGYLDPGPEYRLTVRMQPMVNADHLVTSITSTPGWQVHGPSTGTITGSSEVRTQFVRFARSS